MTPLCELVAGVLDGGPNGGVVDGPGARDAQGTRLEEHLDRLESGDLLDLSVREETQWSQVIPATV